MDKSHDSLDEYFKIPRPITEGSDLNAAKCGLTAKVRQFSNESIHRPGEEVPFDCSLESVWFDDEELPLSVYANGINNESKGYVSLRLRVNNYQLLPVNEYSEFCCIVSVIDSSGNKRFLRSFAFPYYRKWRTGIQTFDINRYIKRETLLGETLDLLPEDCLSLHIDATIKEIGFENESSIFVATDVYLTLENRGYGEKLYLSLNNVLAERLKEESTYFRRMSECAMEEKRTRYMNVPADEYKPFRRMCEIVLGSNSINVDSIHDICLVYILADKYDIPVATETCRRLMISFLRVRNNETIVEHVDQSIPEILELAETFNDVRLKEIVERFLKYKKEGIENGNRTWEDKQDNLESEWEVRILEDNPSPYTSGAEILEDSPTDTSDELSSFHLWRDVKWHQDKLEFEFYQ